MSSSQLIFLDPPWAWENKPRWHIPALARGWHSSQKHGFLRLMPGVARALPIPSSARMAEVKNNQGKETRRKKKKKKKKP